MNDRPRYPWIVAEGIAEDICNHLRPGCKRIKIAGSLRRQKPDVGDIEILYIPVMQEQPDPEDLFRSITVSLAGGRIDGLERARILGRRLNSKGSEMYGPKNKLMVHIPSGIHVDLFTATEENWFNYLVCRTGPKELNLRICMAAIDRGWKWNPYGIGFSRGSEIRRMESEEAVFEFAGLPYRQPKDRI